MSDSKVVNVFAVLSKAGLVFTDGDNIDWDTTLVAIQDRVSAEREAASAWDTQILAALNGVFDKLKAGQRIPEPMAVNLAIREMAPDATVEEMQELTVKIADFLDRTDRFTGKRGRNGGLGRE